ncbi:MAG: hypothetical protein ACYC3I_14750 [Gemmataceae bacterium]
MHNGRLARRLLCLVLLFFLTLGCQTFQKEQTLAVLVRDAETKKPIATAEVYLCQRLKQDEVAPCHSSAFTQADGIAHLYPEPGGEQGIQVQTVAQGYLPEKLNVSAEVLKKSALLTSSGSSEARPPDVTLDVYAEPSFSVELVLPPGYRGLVKAEIQIEGRLPLPARQRCFRYPVSASGDVQVVGPSLLQRVPAPEFRARYADGPLLGTAMDAEIVGFRWLKGAGTRHYFVVGTQVDYEALHRQLAPQEAQAENAWEDAAKASGGHKYRYGKITAPNYQ